jgi:hypothetical protein
MQNDVGLDREVVWRNFGGREPWDLILLSTVVGGAHRYAIAADPFEFVYMNDEGSDTVHWIGTNTHCPGLDYFEQRFEKVLRHVPHLR